MIYPDGESCQGFFIVIPNTEFSMLNIEVFPRYSKIIIHHSLFDIFSVK